MILYVVCVNCEEIKKTEESKSVHARAYFNLFKTESWIEEKKITKSEAEELRRILHKIRE